MSDFFQRFNWKYLKDGPEIPYGILVIWVIVVLCAIGSVRAQDFNERQKWFWIGLIVLLPGIGLMAYLPFAIKKDTIPQMFPARKPQKGKTALHRRMG